MFGANRGRPAGGGSGAEPRQRRPRQDGWAPEEEAGLQPDHAGTRKAQRAVRAERGAAQGRQLRYTELSFK